jgi:hypothetical protein
MSEPPTSFVGRSPIFRLPQPGEELNSRLRGNDKRESVLIGEICGSLVLIVAEELALSEVEWAALGFPAFFAVLRSAVDIVLCVTIKSVGEESRV